MCSSLKPFKCMVFTPLSGQNVHPIHSKYIECATLFFTSDHLQVGLASWRENTKKHHNTESQGSFSASYSSQQTQTQRCLPTKNRLSTGPWNKLFSLCSELLLLCRVRTCWYRHLPGVTAGNYETVWCRNDSKIKRCINVWFHHKIP